MANCGLLTANIAPDCNYPIISGVNDRLWIINKDDISSFTYNGSNNEIVEGITLLSGKSAWTIEGQNFSNEPDYAFTINGFSVGYNHSVRVKIFEDTPDVKQQLNLLARGKYIIIVENNYVNGTGNTAFTMYGHDSGLRQTEGTQPKNSAETGGAHDILLASNEQALESKVPRTVFITSYAATKAMLVALQA